MVTTVMSDRFSGTLAASFAGDGIYSNFSGTAPVFISDSYYGRGLQFTAATAGQIAETFTGTTVRTFDRVYLISAAPTAACDIMDIRDGSAAAVCKIGINLNGHLQLKNAAGTGLTGGASANVMPLGARFRVAITMNGTALTAVVYNNDTDNTVLETITPSGTITGGTAVSCREGFITAGGMGTGITFSTYWPQDGDTGPIGVRSLWIPNQSARRRSLPARRARRASTFVSRQIAPPIQAKRVVRKPAPLRRVRATKPPFAVAILLPPAFVRQAVGRKVRWVVGRFRHRPPPTQWPQSVAIVHPPFEWEGEWLVGMVDDEWLIGNPDIDPSGLL